MKNGRPSVVGGQPSSMTGRASSHIGVVRCLALAVLAALGACTILTAGLLLTRAIEKPSDALVWVGGRQQQSIADAPAEQTEAQQPSRPITKELDPDYVVGVQSAEQVVQQGKECPPGCERQGNCNAEEGR